MLKLILGAAMLTILPLLAVQQLGLPALPAPVQLFGESGRVIILESVRLADAAGAIAVQPA
jgi:hypothetical protein